MLGGVGERLLSDAIDAGLEFGRKASGWACVSFGQAQVGVDIDTRAAGPVDAANASSRF